MHDSLASWQHAQGDNTVVLSCSSNMLFTTVHTLFEHVGASMQSRMHNADIALLVMSTSKLSEPSPNAQKTGYLLAMGSHFLCSCTPCLVPHYRSCRGAVVL